MPPMSGLLEGQVALVTGAGGGIGRGIASRFAQEGAAVVLHCRTAVEAAGAVASRIRESGRRAVVVRGDLTDEDACRRVVGEAAEWGGGRLTALVNNAGVQPTQELPGMTAAEWRAVVDANLSSVFACTQAAVDARSAALEYGPFGIRVNTVSPGLIHREGLEEAWPEGVRRWERVAPTGRLGRPEDVGDACVFLASGLASWVTGHDLVVDGGVSARPTW
ncbi:SDR family NAD(P)-dependent oxidoreductase [Streptomyces sp. CA-251387]|uniref:SDR family NAD(P)-dependent oxidoreductase n=1 Tax=Streptomyces sp. CA-251387 TaxID=3240064 RepID=UPI003D94259B